jgi:hypothetical protein
LSERPSSLYGASAHAAHERAMHRAVREILFVDETEK